MVRPITVGALDHEYMLETHQRGINHKWHQRYFKSAELIGLENLASIGSSQFFGFSNHVSMWDYLEFGNRFIENLPIENFPRIIAGSNLDSRILSLLHLNFRRTGAFFVDRTKIKKLEKEERKKYLEKVDSRAKRCLTKGDSFWDFIEGGRNRTENVLEVTKSGIVKSLIKSGINPLILTAAISYDHVPEHEFYPIIDWAKGRKGFNWLYYTADAAAFLSAPFNRKNRKNVYVNFGKPVRLHDIASGTPSQRRSQLINYTKEEIKRLYDEISK